MRRLLALKSIDNDRRLKLTESQRREVKNRIKNHTQKEYEELRKLYRRLHLPSKDGFKQIDISVPTFGETLIDKEIYEYLRSQGEVLEKIAPKVIRDKYLAEKDFIEIKKLYEAFLKTPGEIRLISQKSFVESVKDGVKNGLFGFGHISDGKIECKYINQIPDVSLSDGEIILRSELCVEDESEVQPIQPQIEAEEITIAEESEAETAEETREEYSRINLKLKVPVGQISTVAKIVNYLKNRFNRCEVEITINASNGKLQVTEYDDRIKEALNQGAIEIEKEEKR